MTGVAIPLANVLLGLARVGTGIGFGAAEREKMNELDEKSKKLKKDINTAGNFYDHIYYPVAVNLQRVKKALDKLPNDFVEKVQKDVISDIKNDNSKEAIATVANVLGYIGKFVKLGPNFLQIIVFLRDQKAESKPSEALPDPFELVPMGKDKVPELPTTESSLPKTPMLENVENGLNIAAIVFGVAGLAATIGLGVWTLETLAKAISDVDNKQVQVTVFSTAMKTALDPAVKDAGLPPESYGELTLTVLPTWKKTSEDFESYQKELYYAIRGYFMNKSSDDIKKLVDKESDAGMTYPPNGYKIAKKLAAVIKKKIGQKKTDKEIVSFFANDYPDKNLRCFFEEYFISTLRWHT